MRRLEVRYPSREALVADHAQSLSQGRAFVAGAAAGTEREACAVVLVHPETDERIEVRGEIVWNAPNGVGVALRAEPNTAAKLAAFVGTTAVPATAVIAEEMQEGERGAARNIHERVRALASREREELARRGGTAERVALERAFGASVWEGLLLNPQVSVMEVARIAKNGSLPKALVNLIVNNAGWLAVADVQRALLSNPRCAGPHLDRVLRAMNRADVARLAQSCPYRPEVRTAAQRIAGPKER